MRTTIKDIANYTGLSVTTISLVLNGKDAKIPIATRKLVIEAAKKLDYHPNQLAVGLVKKQTNTIGLVISDVSNVFFANLAKGVEGECRRMGWNLILCNTNDMHKRELEYIQVLADKSVDGILLCLALDNDESMGKECINLMEKMMIPYVLIDRYLDDVHSCTVMTDHRYGGYLATKHLISLGHKKIACVTGPSNLKDSRDRLRGYRDALDEYGIPFLKELIYEGKYDWESGNAAVEKLLKESPTAIFAFNDMSVYGVYNGLKERGISVPRDISIVGYDNLFFSEILDVPLTTVSQPIKELGVEAVQQLVSEIKLGKNIEKRIVLQPKLIIRKSTGKPVNEGDVK